MAEITTKQLGSELERLRQLLDIKAAEMHKISRDSEEHANRLLAAHKKLLNDSKKQLVQLNIERAKLEGSISYVENLISKITDGKFSQ